MMRFIERALKTVGPRPSCSKEERALGHILETDWQDFCDDVRADAFSCAPHAFLGVIPIAAGMSLLSIGILSHLPWLSALISGFAASVVIWELLFYRELADRVFPSKQGVNVIGIIPPNKEVRRRVVLTAHQDSAWEFNLWYWFKSAGVVINLLGLVGMLVPLVLGLLVTFDVLAADGSTCIWSSVLVAPFIALHLFFHTGNIVPGAMDDLAGLAVITEAGRSLAAQRLDHTEIWLVACSAEECGLRGSKRFVAKYGWVLHQLPTWDINIDGVYDEAYLAAVTRELTTGTVHDPNLVSLAQSVADNNGWKMQRAVIPFGGTDAASFASAGIRSVALLCQDTNTLAPNYHTRLDTLDRVRPESLTVMHGVVTGMVSAIDQGFLDAPSSPE